MTNDEANRVIAVTSRDLILSVRNKFRTTPADGFSWWLDLEIERIAGLPGQIPADGKEAAR